MKFSEVPNGLFRFNGLVYTKISESQAVLITSGKIVDFAPDDEVEMFQEVIMVRSVLHYENRINLLKNRQKENQKIVQKLERNLRKIQNEPVTQSEE